MPLYAMFAVRIGNEDWQEELITEDKTRPKWSRSGPGPSPTDLTGFAYSVVTTWERRISPNACGG